MIVVADASPLIFLAKLKRLELIPRLLGHDIRVPRRVYREVLGPRVESVERSVLELFFSGCSIEVVRRPRRYASLNPYGKW